MLVLQRQRNETIMIGHDIKIVVVEVRGGIVRLGIEAPQDVDVHRLEVYNAIQRTKQNEINAKIKAAQEEERERISQLTDDEVRTLTDRPTGTNEDQGGNTTE